MRTVFLTVLGLSILLLVVYDVYATILHARGRSGPIGETLNRTIWRAARFLAFRFSRPRRHRLLNVVGPTLLPLLIIVFIALLVLGFAFVYYPRMPENFSVQPGVGAADTPWVSSLYFSGVTLTTVGYGDIAPRTMGMRLTSLFESASGFALISLAITYLITVYRALERKRAVALSFYHQAEEGANVAAFIAHHFVAGRFYGLTTTLRMATRDIQGLLESHVEHPVIHYFHPLEVYKSLPRMLFLSLEICAVIRSCLDDEEYAETVNHPEVRTLEASSRHVLHALLSSLELERRSRRRKETPFEESRRWRARFEQTVAQLKEAGIKMRADGASAWEFYRARREEWEAQLHRFSSHLGYDWDEITGDGDLRYAADEKMEEPGRGGG
ncbi:MAG TPA: potassium channel family protein [Pyrinomonadaceae bacterium]|nr:potassium channel family protein [Pyrinomonadaceae bacterium]